jgi:ATP-dependent DNA helicase RecG
MRFEPDSDRARLPKRAFEGRIPDAQRGRRRLADVPGMNRRMMSQDPLETSVQYLRGVGPKRAELLAKLELRTVADLLWNMPRDFLDLTDVRPVERLEPDHVQSVRGKVVDLDARELSRGRTLSAVLLDCDGAYLRGVWFNQPWILKKFRPEQTVLFSGKPKRNAGRWEMSHPTIQYLDDDESPSSGGVLPRYSLTEGLKMHEMRRIIRNAVEEYASLVADALPAPFREAAQLPALSDALRYLHIPADREQFEAGKRCLIYHDLLDFQLALALRRRYWKKRAAAPKMPATAKIDARIRRLFPFSLTAGQETVVREIAADLDSGWAMHRLLQADVGAGKTAVAIYAMLVAVAAGHQAALMTPTELLAVQHWNTLERMLAHSRVERALLTGALTGSQRRATLDRLRAGALQVVVGTQAIIQKDVEFQRLGLAVIDEQHKFGVVQRAHFSTGDDSTHILVMTATPIPRSLCLTQFGDLDLSVISDLPPGRQRVVTSRVAGAAVRKKAWDFIRQKLQSGRQAYIVCPRVEGDAGDSEAAGDAGAEQMFRQLAEGELRDYRVGLVHGRMDRDLKARTMEEFRSGTIQALVSTTVVEVGVDVPNATLMVILQAERFGLSQLHQLRGRIGRGQFQGYCFLFSEADKPDAVARLQALESTSDGFKIAEADFQLRGPGDVLGTRQHGDLPLRVADLVRDQKILLETRKAAFELVESGEFDTPAFAPLKIRVLERFERQMELVGTG